MRFLNSAEGCPLQQVRKATATATANAKAEKDEATQYPAMDSSRSVIALSHELFGRLGDSAEHVLQVMAAVGVRRDHWDGRPPINRLRRWPAVLDATLHRGVVAQLECAWRGMPGRSRGRSAPRNVQNFQASPWEAQAS